MVAFWAWQGWRIEMGCWYWEAGRRQERLPEGIVVWQVDRGGIEIYYIRCGEQLWMLKCALLTNSDSCSTIVCFNPKLPSSMVVLLLKMQIFPSSAKHVYASPHVYWGILHWKARVGCRESWVMLWDSSTSKKTVSLREGSNFNLESEGLEKQLSTRLQLNYSSTREVSLLKNLTRSSPLPNVFSHTVSFTHKMSRPHAEKSYLLPVPSLWTAPWPPDTQPHSGGRDG